MKFETECVHYVGCKPCRYNRLCQGCEEFAPAGPRVLIVKTAALGDVLRTTSLPPAICRTLSGARITWLTAPQATPLLAGNPQVHEVLPFDHAAWPALAPRRFDLIVSLDKEPGPAGLAVLLNGERKCGVGLSPSGVPEPLNPEAERYFALGLSDELKFRENKKSYHQLIAEACGLEYGGEHPVLNLTRVERESGLNVLRRAGWDGAAPLVGINTGAGSEFANKMLSTAGILDAVDAVAATVPGAFIVLLGGPREAEKNAHIARAGRLRAVDAGCHHPLRVFAGMISHCGVLLAGDTLAMHIAIALGIPVAALFGPTTPVEIDLFGNGEKLVGNTDCAPCYKKECNQDPTCMDALELDHVAETVARLLKR